MENAKNKKSKDKQQSRQQSAQPQKPKAQKKIAVNKRALAVIIAVVVIAAIVFTSLFYGLYSSSSSSFTAFQSNFNSAKNVGIYINYTNSSSMGSLVACSSALIEELSGVSGAHRNASSISLFVLYNNSCIYKQGLGQVAKNFSNATRQYCLNISRTMPSIFIAYGPTNGTVITSNRLYFVGDQKFITECGIAYQIT